MKKILITLIFIVPLLSTEESLSKNINDHEYQLVKKSCSNLSEECERACRAANSLKDSSNNLASCANRHDYSEDCQRKYKAVRNDFDSYEQAVSQASGRCD